MEKLIKCIKAKICAVYWDPSINFLGEMSEEDLAFINQRLDIVSADILKAIADDWIKPERCVRLNYCGCCVVLDYKRYKVETDVNKFQSIEILCRCGDTNCCRHMEFGEGVICVY